MSGSFIRLQQIIGLAKLMHHMIAAVVSMQIVTDNAQTSGNVTFIGVSPDIGLTADTLLDTVKLHFDLMTGPIDMQKIQENRARGKLLPIAPSSTSIIIHTGHGQERCEYCAHPP